jgi:hypothetical protein
MTGARPDPARLDAERAADPSRRHRGPLECRRICERGHSGDGRYASSWSRALHRLLGDVARDQRRVQAAALEQFVVRAALDDPSVVEYRDLVGVPDGR